jgi:hypothetical protein
VTVQRGCQCATIVWLSVNINDTRYRKLTAARAPHLCQTSVVSAAAAQQVVSSRPRRRAADGDTCIQCKIFVAALVPRSYGMHVGLFTDTLDSNTQIYIQPQACMMLHKAQCHRPTQVYNGTAHHKERAHTLMTDGIAWCRHEHHGSGKNKTAAQTTVFLPSALHVIDGIHTYPRPCLLHWR